MSFENYHFAFRAGDELHDVADGFINRMAVPAAKPEPKTVDKMMRLMVSEIMSAYISTPMQLIEVEPKVRRMLNLATGTVNKTAGIMVGVVTRKMSKEQCLNAAEYIDGSRLLYEDGATSCVAFPIPGNMASDAAPMIASVRARESEAEIHRMKDWLMELSHVGADHFIGQPLDVLELGPVAKKVATKGAGAITNAIQAMIRDTIPQLTPDQAAVFADYLDHLVIEYD